LNAPFRGRGLTTKPTGQGTGLGLSLSCDIIKAHDREIKVETKEGEGADFVIQLPASVSDTFEVRDIWWTTVLLLTVFLHKRCNILTANLCHRFNFFFYKNFF
jgi:hypothetical protein